MNIVKVLSSSVLKGFRQIKILRLGKDDVLERPQVAPHGVDSVPVKDMVAIYAPTLDRSESVIIGYIGKEHVADIGETRIYSTDSDGNTKISLHLKNDGTAEFGGNTKNMVRFQELEAGFNELKSAFNGLVTRYNSHIHITTATVGATAVPGILAPTVLTGSTTTASIAGAKIDEIKTG